MYAAMFWAAIFIGALIIEFMTQQLVSIWFVPGALVSFILALCKVNIWIQIAVFTIITLICLFGLRGVAKKLLNKAPADPDTNTDLIVGHKVKLLKSVTNESNGEIKVNDIIWTAASEDGQTIEKDSFVIVTAIKGNKLIVKKGE